jgi:methyl-accepting chemotaxis protein
MKKIEAMNFLKNMTIKKKLRILIIIILVAANIVSLLGVVFLQITNSDYDAALTNYGFSQGDIGKFGMNIEDMNSVVRDILTDQDPNDVAIANAMLQKDLRYLNSNLLVLKKEAITSDEISDYNKIYSISNQYVAALKEVTDLSRNGSKDDALYSFRIKGNVFAQQIVSSINDMMKLKISIGNNIKSGLALFRVISIIIIIITLILEVLTAIIFARYIISNISQSINKVAIITEKISEGDLNVTIDVETNDEFGYLLVTFRNMINSLKDYIKDLSKVLGSIEAGNLQVKTSDNYKGDFIEIKNSLDNIISSLNFSFMEIRDSALLVNSGAEQLSIAAQTLSEGAMDQTGYVDELFESINIVNEQVHINADNAEAASNSSLEFKNTIEKSNEKMIALLSSMDNITKVSENISKIIADIDSITKQTDLLALNAAIEAARAGEAGKGFAVVAEEVRKLSFQSSDAAKKTNILIDDSLKAVETVKALTYTAVDNLQEVVKKVDDSTLAIEIISNASKDQAISIDAMNSEISKIHEVIQHNSATSEETAAASEQLKAQAENLNAVLEKFKLIR